MTESRASLESEDDLDNEELPTSIIRRDPQPAPGASKPSLTLHSSFVRGPKTCIPLKLLFNYSIEPEEGVAFYWKGGFQSLQSCEGVEVVNAESDP